MLPKVGKVLNRFNSLIGARISERQYVETLETIREAMNAKKQGSQVDPGHQERFQFFLVL